MMIAARNAFMTRRLPYDAELEYLESTGTQWIDTGVKKTTTTTIDCLFSLTDTATVAVFGGRESQATTDSFVLFNLGTLFRFDANNKQGLSLTPNTTSIFRFQYDGSNAIITDTTIGSVVSRAVNIGNDGTMYIALFANNTNGTIENYLKGRIYSFKLWSNGVLVRDFIPVRRGNVGYLYDRVTGKLFGNAGTGDFVLGPDVVPVKYLESTGTQWIDTELDYFADFEVGIKLRGSVVNKALGTSGTMCLERNSASEPNWLLNVNNTKYHSNASIVDYHVMSWKGGVFAADGVTVHTVSNPFSSGNMMLFGAGFPYPNMIYACKLWDANGIHVRSFRPVRVGTDATSWEGAMMDVLTRRIYRNAGTGAFSYGNDLKYPVPAE